MAMLIFLSVNNAFGQSRPVLEIEEPVSFNCFRSR